MATQRLFWPVLAVAAAGLGFAPGPTHAKSAPLLDMSLEELLSLEVTSVSKKSQQVSETAAAVFVVTADDIRHAGARSIPEALQGVPGLQVAQIDGNKWAISARGFNGRFANNRIRFEINPVTSREAGLRVNAQLMQLSTIVQTASGAQ